MVDAETIDEKLEKKTIEENLSEAAEEMGTRESEQVFEDQTIENQSTPAEAELMVKK